LSRILHLSLVQEVVFGLVCLESANYSTFALQFVKQKLPELIKSYINSGTKVQFIYLVCQLIIQFFIFIYLFCVLFLDINTEQVTGGGLHDSSPEVLHLILSHVFAVDDQIFGMLNIQTTYSFVFIIFY